MPDYTTSPFEKVFNPDSEGTLTGLLGRAFGNSTAVERAGNARAGALDQVGQLMQQGLTPQQALIRFVQTPQGQEWFARDPNFTDTLAKIQQMATPPAPVMNTLNQGQTLTATNPLSGTTSVAASVPAAPVFQTTAPNQQTTRTDASGNTTIVAKPPPAPETVNTPAGTTTSRISPTGVVTPVATMPTGEVQTFKQLGDLANLPTTDLQDLARLNMLPKNATTSTEEERAVQRLVTSGAISREVGDRLIAKTAVIQPMFNATHDQIGFAVWDKTNNTLLNLGAGGAASGQPGGAMTPEGEKRSQLVIPPNAQNADGTLDPNRVFDDPLNMFLGAGIAPMLAGAVSGIMESIDPKLQTKEGALAQTRRLDLEAVRNASLNMLNNASGLNMNKKVVEETLALLPGMGPFETPWLAVVKGIKAIDRINSEISAAEATQADRSLPAKVRIQAADQIAAWNGVKRTLPPRERMIMLEKKIREGTAGALTIGGAVSGAIEGAKTGLGAAKTQADEVLGTGAPGAAPAPTSPVPTSQLDFSKMDKSTILKLDTSKMTNQQKALMLQRVIELQGAP